MERHIGDPQTPVRIYAPVGSHKELLAYLVRRLLENGANSSFVNRIADEQVSIDDLVRDPVAELEALGVARVSTASQVALMAMSMTRQIADELRATGRFDKLAPTMAQGDAQPLFTGL